jgi:conjugal transfer ATP-binding protein TraC
MAALGAQREGRVEGIEEKAISDAVFAVWNEKGPAGEITDVYRKLKARVAADPRLDDVCTKLKSFTHDGVYGKYFQGQATVDVETPFTVVELSNLKSQPDLEQVVLQIIMFLGTELMFKTDRSVPVAILIDEAWDLLKGVGTAKFIEGVVRRARKYTGALITGTQSVDDYFQNQAAEVCLQNSDWTVFLAQNPETIDRLEQMKRLSIPPGFGAKLKSITSVPGQFSEMAVKGPGGWFFGRLMLDPFSLAVFSSKGATVEHLKRRRAEGLTTVEALKDMVAKGDVA